MTGCHSTSYRGYYGVYDDKPPIRSLADDLLIEKERIMLEEMKHMEERLKRHITECKREVIKELQSIFSDKKPKPKPNKESKA
jgi:hypothetical protein